MKMMIVDDNKEFIEMVFKPKLKQWGVDDEIISNRTFCDLTEDSLPGFTTEVIEIAQTLRPELIAIFLDLALTKGGSGTPLELASQGFRLAKALRGAFVDVPIIALTQFGEKEVIEEGYLYDLDHYITKTSFGDLGSRGFNGIMHQAIEKRKYFIDNLPAHYGRLQELRGEAFTMFSAFGRNFTTRSRNMEAEAVSGGVLESLIAQSMQLTVVMFADLCNSTAIKEKQGFIEGLYLTKMHNQIVTNAICSRNGKIVKYIGDCVMARFDYSEEPEVNADAILCAVGAMETIFEHNKRYRKGAEFQIESKIGIAVGRTIDFYGNDPQGSCVDLAARIQSEAKPGQILISKELEALVNASHLHSALGKAKHRSPGEYIEGPQRLKLKGFREEQDVYEVVWGDGPLSIGEK